MTIQPLSGQPREIGVTEAIEPALDRVKAILFRPFDFTKWLIIGFCAWLAVLGESGGSFSFPGNFEDRHEAPREEFRHAYIQVHDYVVANLTWLLPLVIFGTALVLVLGLVILWLNCRGKFMFLHCVALNVAEVDVPWRKYAAQGNSLFWFRLVLSIVGTILCVPLVIFMVVIIYHMVMRGEPDAGSILLLLALIAGLAIIVIPLLIIRKFTADFVVPIMSLRGTRCLAAWRELASLISANPGRFVIYILFSIVLEIVIALLTLALVPLTCCVACCILPLPFLGTVLLLPILVFKRAFSLHYLAQYGSEYDVFPPTVIQPISPTAPLNA